MSSPGTLRRWLWPKSLGGKLIAVFAISLLLVVGLWFAALMMTERRLAAVIERCRELGYSETLSPPEPPVEEELNSAVPFERAGAMAQAAIEEITKQSLTKADERAAGVVADAARRLAGDSNYERLLKEADERAHYHSTTDAAAAKWLWPAAPDRLNDLLKVESQIAFNLALSGDPAKGAERLLRLLRLYRRRAANDSTMGFVARYFSQQPIFHELNRLLRGSSLSKETHERIDAELSAHDELAGKLAPALRQRQFNAWLDFKRQTPLYRYSLFKPLANIDQAFAFERLELALLAPTHTAAAKQVYLRHPLDGLPYFNQDFGNNVLQATTFARLNGDVFRSRLRALRILNAMTRTRNFNAKLESLGLPAESLIDPFSDLSMRVVNDERGLRIYSVGPNGQDDQGLLDAPAQIWDVGFGPTKAETP